MRRLPTCITIGVCAVGWFGPYGWAAAPRIGQTHDPAWAGHTMVVAGDGFVPKKTEFRIWSPQWDEIDRRRAAQKPDTQPVDGQTQADVERLLAYLGQALPPLPAAPPANSMACPILKCTNQLAAVEFPRYLRYHSGPATRYLAVLYAGDKENGWSAPWLFNRTAAHFLTADEATPGASLRVIGRNLWAAGPPPLVALVDRNTQARIRCSVQSRFYGHYNFNAFYDWEFTVPASASAGTYEVRVHDGTGEAYGWSGPLPLRVAAARADTRKVFDAGLYGVKADGVADDGPALQKVLDAAGQAAPSVLLLPAGISISGKPIAIPPGVTLRGRGMHNSILRSAPGAAMYTMITAGNDFALEDLCLEGSGPSVRLLLSIGVRDGLAENVRLQRCRFLTTEPDRPREIAIDRVRRMSIIGCQFNDVGAYGSYMELSYIGHNRSEVTHWLYGGLGLGLGRVTRHCLVEHNHGIGPRGSGTVSTGCHFQSHFARNTVERTLSCDGEAYLLEGAGAAWYGKPVSPRPDQVKFPAQYWTVYAKGPAVPAWLDQYLKPYVSQYVIVITKGKGLGQYRRIAALKGDTLLLESPWAVPPDASSEAALMHGSIECALVNNMAFHTNGTTGGLFLAGGMNTIVDGQVGVDTGGPYVWSSVEPVETARTDGLKFRVVPDYFNQILHGRWHDKANIFLTDGVGLRFKTDQLEAIPQLGTLVAENDIRYPKDCGWGASSFIDLESDPRQDQDNPDRGKFPAVVVAGKNLFPAVEENRVRSADVGVWLGPRTEGAIVRRNVFNSVRFERVKDLGHDSLIGASTNETEWHSFWGAGLNIDLLPEHP
ncbi:MAG: glycosyl hydrolase family 28-related protein [Thermoguttaceae bacterium]